MALLVNLGLNYFLVPELSYYGVIIAMFASIFVQTISFYFISMKLTGIRWNKKKMLFFPIVIVLLTAILEVAKIQFNINPYVTSSAVILIITASLSFLYRSEIRQIFNRYLR